MIGMGNTLKELESKVDDTFGMLNCIKIISDVDKFTAWLEKEHNIKNTDNIFEGYKFFLESAIRTFLFSIVYDSALGIKEDILFSRCRHKGVKLDKIPNTSEKTILIKNIYERLKLIRKAQNWDEIRRAILQYMASIIDAFDRIFDSEVIVSKKLGGSKEDALKYATMFHTYTFLNDISDGLPHGYWLSILDNRISEERYNKIFEGYKYSLQFVWFSLLGGRYASTSIKDLHKSDSWIIPELESDHIIDPHAEPKPHSERNDLDSYHWRIGEEIIDPLEKNLKISLILDKILYIKNIIHKDAFKDLLKPPKEPQLSEKEKLNRILLEYKVELLDSSKSNTFSGVPAFVYLLAGTAEMKRGFAKGEKAYVCRFVHPDKSVNGNDLSYGILIDAFGSMWDHSGWILFFDCCGDYSGFAGSQHALAEAFIKRYEKVGLIDVKEMVIEKNKFKEYIIDAIASDGSEPFDEYSPKKEKIMNQLDEEARKNKRINFIGEAKGLINELLTYYILSKEKESTVDWNVMTDGGQLDITVETDTGFRLIECKFSPDSINVDDEIEKLKTKSANYPTSKTKVCEFWFWERPSPITIDKMKNAKVDYQVLSDLIHKDKELRSKAEKLKLISRYID